MMGILLRKKSNEFQKALLDDIVLCKRLTYANAITTIILSRGSNSLAIKIGEVNHNHIRFQVKEDDVDSSETCFTSETVSLKRRFCYQNFAEISDFEVITKRSTH